MCALKPRTTTWPSVRVTIPKWCLIILLVPTRWSWWLQAWERNENRNSHSMRKTSSAEFGLGSSFLLTSYIAYLAEALIVQWKASKNQVSRSRTMKNRFRMSGSFFFIMKYYMWDFCALAWRKHKKPMGRTEGRLSSPQACICFSA